MRTIAPAAVGLTVTLLVVLPATAYAGSYLDEADQAMQSGNVYVSVETRTIDAATKEHLIQLTKDTDIGVVVLPEGAHTEAADLPQFVINIVRDSGKETVIVAVGHDLEAASSTMPGTVVKLANDLERSNSSTGDALVKFVTEVRSAKPADSSQTDTGPDLSGIGIPIAIVLAIGVSGFMWLRSKRKSQAATRQKTEIVEVPQSIRRLLSEIDKFTVDGNKQSRSNDFSIHDDEMRLALTKAASNTDKLFVLLIKNKTPGIQQTSEEYERMLSRLQRILQTYVAVQNHGDDYRDVSDPEWQEKLLESGKAAVTEYAQGVLKNVREINRGSLTTFYGDVYLMEQRFKDS